MTESNGNTPEAHGQDLPIGSRLQEFVVERTIGFGGFGITYLAHDTSLGRKVVIKEHLPDMFSFRDVASMTVRPRHTSGETMENYEWSMGSFMREAEMLASLEHPNIVRILRRFEANGTAYFVMPFVEGQSFDKVIKSREAAGACFSETELRDMLDPLLGAFGYLHSRAIYHRDVKPGNLLVTASGVPVLIDFGAARQQFGEKSMTVIESAGYTPFEQTESRGNVGPWSDLYALGGVLRKAITYQTPARSADRIRRDPMVKLTEDPQWSGRFSKVFLETVDRSLRVDEETRWQRAEDWLETLRQSTMSANPRVAFQSPPIPPPAGRPVSAPPASSPPPASQPSLSRDYLAEGLPSVPRPKAAAVPTSRRAKPAGKAPRKKSRAVLLLVMLLCAGGTGSAAWWFWLGGKSAEPLAPTPDATTTSSPNAHRIPEVAPIPKERAPDPAQWEQLAGTGDAFASALLGEALTTGMSGQHKDTDGGLKWLAQASDAKHPLGIFLLAEQRMLRAETLQKKSGATAVLSKGQETFREAFTLGFYKDVVGGGAEWSAALGRAYDRGLGTEVNPKKALQWLTAAGQAGHVWSQYLLGEIYESGRGVIADQEAAARWYEKAARAGWPAAQSAMARMCSRGPAFLRDERQALVWAKQAAAAGDCRGQEILGEFHETGVGVKADASEAVRCYLLAVEQGDVGAKGRLGRMYLQGKGLEQSNPKALRLLQEAVDGGDKFACQPLGAMYETGRGVLKNSATAVKYYKDGVEAGDLAAKTSLAVCMEQGTGMSANPAAAVSIYQETAAAGNPEARFHLGMLMLQGKGIKQDAEQATGLLKKASDQGLPSAQFEYGKCLENGLSIGKNESAAFKLYEDAAKDGVAEADYRAGLMLEQGRGTYQNYAAAMLHYKTAADSGNASAQVNLGIMFAQGRGTTKDDAQAVGWYRKAAELEDKDGLMLLGMMCEFGQGTPRSSQEAARCYRKAAAQGDTEAEQLLKILKP